MGDRFYRQQIETTGSCPGFIGKRRRRVAWDDDKKAMAIEMYEEKNPTPENSMEIVAEVADELGESPNGVRTILSRAGVYIKKEPGASKPASGGTGGGRVSKAASQEALSAAIEATGHEVDAEIISKLTGKAAVYFTSVLTGDSKDEE